MKETVPQPLSRFLSLFRGILPVISWNNIYHLQLCGHSLQQDLFDFNLLFYGLNKIVLFSFV